MKIDEDWNVLEDMSKGGSRLTGRWKHKEEQKAICLLGIEGI